MQGARSSAGLVACLAVSSAWSASAPQSSVEAVTQATRAFYAALNRGDATDADQYLLPGGDSFPRDGAPLSPEAATQDKSLEELRARFRSGLKFNVTLRDLHVSAYGETAAVATFYTTGTTSMQGKTLSEGTYRASYVWVNVSGRWQIAHFHLSPLKP